MKKTFKEVYNEHDAKILTSIILLTFIGMALLNPNSVGGKDYKRSENFSKNIGCSIEYSKPLCQDGEIVTVFHNPGDDPIRNVEVVVPDGKGGENIYEPGSPLPPNETSYLVTGNCQEQDMEKMSLGYCCEGECTRTDMENPSEDLGIEEIKDE